MAAFCMASSAASISLWSFFCSSDVSSEEPASSSRFPFSSSAWAAYFCWASRALSSMADCSRCFSFNAAIRPARADCLAVRASMPLALFLYCAWIFSSSDFCRASSALMFFSLARYSASPSSTSRVAMVLTAMETPLSTLKISRIFTYFAFAS